MNFAANIVWLLHILLVVWVVVTPFTSNEPMLLLHLFAIPTLWIHWTLSDDTCSLTLLESKLRGCEPTESFFHSLVGPVYKIEDSDTRLVAWYASVVLWLVTVSKVMQRPEMIKDFFSSAVGLCTRRAPSVIVVM